MSVLIEAKLITAILPKGSLGVVKLLRKEQGVNTANFNYARHRQADAAEIQWWRR
jgi:hypothetical protein